MALVERGRLVEMFYKELLATGNRRYENPTKWDEEENRKRNLNQTRAHVVKQYYNELLDMCVPAWVGVELFRIEKGDNGYIGLDYEGNTIVRVKSGSPAERSGVAVGTKITLVEGVRVVDDSRDVTTKLSAAPAIFSLATRNPSAKVKKPKPKPKPVVMQWSRPGVPVTPSVSMPSVTTMGSKPSSSGLPPVEDMNSPPPLPELNSPPRYRNTTGLDTEALYHPKFHTVEHPDTRANLLEKQPSTTSELKLVCDTLRADLINKKNEISELKVEMSHMFGSSRHNNFLATENLKLKQELSRVKDISMKPPPPVPESPPVASPELHYRSNHSMVVPDAAPEIECLWRNAEETTRKTQVELWREQHRSYHLPPRATPATADDASPPPPFSY